jgi:cyclase
MKFWQLRFTVGLSTLSVIGVCAVFQIADAQQSHVTPRNSQNEIEIVRLRPNFYMLAGGGSNIGVQSGTDGMVLVDAGSMDAADRNLAALQTISRLPVRYIVDTSADADHVGGNGRFAKAGRSIFAMGSEAVGGEFAREMTNGYAASILSTENVLKRMSAPTGKVAPFPSESWPTETFTNLRRTIFFNREGVEILHSPAAHSDGDSIVYFRSSDIIAAGDIVDATRFPVIDTKLGGSIQGEIAALNRVIELSVRPMPLVFQEGGTYILPGHGHVYSQQDVVEYRDMIVIIRDIIEDMLKQGMTLEQIQAASPAKGYEPSFGAAQGPWTTRDFVRAIYEGLSKGH